MGDSVKSFKHPDDQSGQIELAYELGQAWWNQGLMTEAAKAVLNFLLNEVGFKRIYANHALENIASGKVMQKCGMIYEGITKQACICNNGVFDRVNYFIVPIVSYHTNKPEFGHRGTEDENRV